MWGVTYGKKKGWEQWKPGCGWGAQIESSAQLAADAGSALWQAVLRGEVTQRAYPDESVTLRCDNGLWAGKSFRLYPPEDQIELGPNIYVAVPPKSGAVKKTKNGISADHEYCWHLVVKGSLDQSQAA